MKMNPHISKLILLILSFNHHQIVVTTALNINLSSLWNLFGYDENSNSNDRSKLIFPKRDLIQELGGKDHYRNLVRHALAMDSSNDSDDSDDSNDGGGVTPVYGVDVGFPMQHAPSNDDADSSTDDNINENSNDNSISTGDGNSNSDKEHITNLKKHQSKLYRNYIQGCNQYYSSTKACDNAEKDRFDMNLNQPPVMQNYTMLGFQKTKIPQDLFKQLKIFWKKHSHKQKMEAWGKRGGEEVGSDTQGSADDNMVQVQADTHVNHWSSPTYMVHIDNPYFQGGGMELKNYIWHVARQALQNWINNGGGNGISNGMSDLSNNNMDVGDETKWTLSPTSMYGIRVYKTGSILAPHVDRLPLVTSAIINVDQDVDEDWPLEVIGHDGVAYNITMEPGDMLLYESHSIIHGEFSIRL
jgi:prolyl 4-hydroxylase